MALPSGAHNLVLYFGLVFIIFIMLVPDYDLEDMNVDLLSSPVPDIPDDILELGLLSSEDDEFVPASPIHVVSQRRHAPLSRTTPATAETAATAETPTTPAIAPAESNDDETDMDSETDVSWYVPDSGSHDDSSNIEEDLPSAAVSPAGTGSKTRKRKTTPKSWKRNITKKRRETGMEYEDLKGKKHAKRSSHSTCTKCTYNCMAKISKVDQQKIFSKFWRLSNDKKLHFYSKFVHVSKSIRKRTDKEVSRRSLSFVYHFEVGEKVVVCKEFFLSTLDISQSRIYYFFRTNIDIATSIPKSPTKGKHVKLQLDAAVVESVRKHILSFPAVESHYCRATTSKKYLDQRLSIAKMFQLYLESEFVINNKPVIQSMYRKIFNTEFNFGFFHPRKDRCDTCEEFKMLQSPTESQVAGNTEHVRLKVLGKTERDEDRANFKRVEGKDSTLVLSFDMENVMALPKAEVSNFFYKRKLNSFNLTAQCSLSGKTYCAMWCEATAGRAGNNIASAIIKILHAVCTDHPDIKKIILWSDSCVPQNRNSIMSTALLMFLTDPNINVKEINQKFSESGHGLIQEVDAIHSKIERGLKKTEIFSPLSLIRVMKSLSTARAPLIIIQMKKTDFFNYQAVSVCYKYNEVPYTKVKQLIYQANEPMYVLYRTSFDKDILIKVRINKQVTARNKKSTSPSSRLFPKVGMLTTPVVLPAEKVKDLQSMYRYMPQVDVEYFKAVLRGN